MLNNLLKPFTQESLVWGGFTVLLGIVVVFSGMALLVFCVAAVGSAITKAEKKANQSKNEEMKKLVEVTKFSDDENEIPEHVKVAIVAAIYAYYADSGVKNEFKVKKIKRI